MVATDDGGCCRRVLVERPGKSVMKFRARAARRVERVGENSAACAQATSSGVLVWWFTASAVWGCAVWDTVRGTVHRRVCWSRLPVRTVMSSCVTVMSSAVNVAVQPTSHNCPMLRSECGWSLGNTWAVVASWGSAGRLISAMPVERIVLPSGRDTVMGGSPVAVLGMGHAAAVRKWPVLPVSAMAVEQRVTGEGEIVGGPVIARQEVDRMFVLRSVLVLCITGSPRRQRGVDGVAVSGRLGRFQDVRSPFIFWIVGHTHSRLARVAVLQCPGKGLEQVALV
jgi:hypothetical protein